MLEVWKLNTEQLLISIGFLHCHRRRVTRNAKVDTKSRNFKGERYITRMMNIGCKKAGSKTRLLRNKKNLPAARV